MAAGWQPGVSGVDGQYGGKGGPKKLGRRKINIEFIEDKSRRHITFSKRKAGIMKKVLFTFKPENSKFLRLMNLVPSLAPKFFCLWHRKQATFILLQHLNFSLLLPSQKENK